eukprot:m51a1_g2373 hypothetical protein (173) ;mRNA; r:668725-669769
MSAITIVPPSEQPFRVVACWSDKERQFSRTPDGSGSESYIRHFLVLKIEANAARMPSHSKPCFDIPSWNKEVSSEPWPKWGDNYYALVMPVFDIVTESTGSGKLGRRAWGYPPGFLSMTDLSNGRKYCLRPAARFRGDVLFHPNEYCWHNLNAQTDGSEAYFTTAECFYVPS